MAKRKTKELQKESVNDLRWYLGDFPETKNMIDFFTNLLGKDVKKIGVDISYHNSCILTDTIKNPYFETYVVDKIGGEVEIIIRKGNTDDGFCIKMSNISKTEKFTNYSGKNCLRILYHDSLAIIIIEE